MNFFEHQDRARRPFRGLFALAVLVILLVVNLAVLLAPHAVPRRGGCRASQRFAAGQGRSAWHDGGFGGADTGRAPGLDDVGAAPQAGLRHRHRGLPGLRRGSADHRRYFAIQIDDRSLVPAGAGAGAIPGRGGRAGGGPAGLARPYPPALCPARRDTGGGDRACRGGAAAAPQGSTRSRRRGPSEAAAWAAPEPIPAVREP
jgi:hypothetical protein